MWPGIPENLSGSSQRNVSAGTYPLERFRRNPDTGLTAKPVPLSMAEISGNGNRAGAGCRSAKPAVFSRQEQAFTFRQIHAGPAGSGE